jgi:tRNA nucleotidyltransferase (CCA-adding enzyme)
LREEDFSRAVERAGGAAYIVGGFVRDVMRGVPPHDRDYVVAGVCAGKFEEAFPGAKRVGGGFPVYRLQIGESCCDVALARSETKTGPGYRGFEVSSGESTTIQDDLARRDTTINSMAKSLSSGEIVDPFGGARDIELRVIRATSNHFKDDPVRALRAARQSAQFGYRIEPGTLSMMGECRRELAGEPPERAARELSLALETERPSLFFMRLREAGLLGVAYPWLSSLAGEVFERAMERLGRACALTRRPEVRYAALVLDIGGGSDLKENQPRCRSNEKSGLCALSERNRATALPNAWVACAEFAVSERRICEITDPGEIVDFLTRLRRHPIGIDGISAVILADSRKLPEFLAYAASYCEAMDEASGDDIPECLTGPARGEWLRGRRIEAVARKIRSDASRRV